MGILQAIGAPSLISHRFIHFTRANILRTGYNYDIAL